MSGENGRGLTSTKESGPRIRFAQEDLEIFSRASGDFNPLHLSEPYASRTAYGEPVVFGALGSLAALGCIRRTDVSINRLTADFHRPMFRNVSYRLEAVDTRDGVTVRLLDGSTPLLTMSVHLVPKQEQEAETTMLADSLFPCAEARTLAWQDLTVGLETRGEYQCDPAALQKLRERWQLLVERKVVEAVLWSSYYVGMEMPGQSALFFRLALDFKTGVCGDGPIRFTTKIANLNRALGQVKIAVELGVPQRIMALGQLTAFVRSSIEAATRETDGTKSGNRLTGKVAVVLGASRGFGAALVQALAREGARVIAVSRSEPAWATRRFSWMQLVETRLADAGNPGEMRQAAQDISEQYRRVDFLVCSAFPAIPSLRLEPEGAERISAYIEKATSLVLQPLCSFLPILQQSDGCAVVISSIAVEKPVRDWPHYVAAKQAIEGLCKVAPLQYPHVSSIIVRPERLLTEMTNTPMGRQGAQDPSILAHELCEHLANPPVAGTCEVFMPGLVSRDERKALEAQFQQA